MGGGVRRGFRYLLKRGALYWRGVGGFPRSLAGPGQRPMGMGGGQELSAPEAPGN